MLKLKNLWISVVVSSCIVLASLVFFSWKSTLFDWTSQIDSSKFGQYGDFVGGLLGTFFAGLTLFLLVHTYRIQRKDNVINRQNQDINDIEILYNNIVIDINNLRFRDHIGTDAFYNFTKANDFFKVGNSVMDDLNSLLFSFENLLGIIRNTNFKKQTVKDALLTRTYFLFYSKVLWPVHREIWSTNRPELLKNHDDSKFIFPRYKGLSKETIEYLTEKDLIAPNKDHAKDIME
jgi:hypothetical protein